LTDITRSHSTSLPFVSVFPEDSPPPGLLGRGLRLLLMASPLLAGRSWSIVSISQNYAQDGLSLITADVEVRTTLLGTVWLLLA
jgi:hypothetical protein